MDISVTSVLEFCRRESTTILAKESVKKIYDLTFTDVHMGCQKVPKSDFQSQFSMSKIIRIFLIFFSSKNISLEEGFLLLSFFENFNF